MNKVPYLKQSKSGHYEYRRRIPERHRHLFPLSKNGTVRAEWHIFLGTTDRTVAHRLWSVENEKFDETVSIIRLDAQRDHEEDTVPLSAIAQAKQQALKVGLHPSQAPRLSYSSTQEEVDNFPNVFREWQIEASEYLSELGSDIQGTYLDEEQRQKDYDAGVWAGAGYQESSLPIKLNDTKVIEFC